MNEGKNEVMAVFYLFVLSLSKHTAKIETLRMIFHCKCTDIEREREEKKIKKVHL